MSTTIAPTTLDLREYASPLPVVKTAQAIRTMPPGELIEVLATDPASVADFRSWCRATGNHLIAWSREDGVFSFLIRRR